MHADRFNVDLVTDAAGAAEGYTPACTGRVLSIQYVKADFANGVDFTVTGDTSGIPIWAESDVNANALRAPRQPTHSQAGVAALYAASGAAVNDHIVVANERIKVAVAQGGDTKSGRVIVTVG